MSVFCFYFFNLLTVHFCIELIESNSFQWLNDSHVWWICCFSSSVSSDSSRFHWAKTNQLNHSVVQQLLHLWSESLVISHDALSAPSSPTCRMFRTSDGFRGQNILNDMSDRLFTYFRWIIQEAASIHWDYSNLITHYNNCADGKSILECIKSQT